MAISTSVVTLKIKGTGETYEKLVDIKTFPDMGAAPTLLEVTTLSDSAQKFISGVQAMAAMEFTANYTDTDFAAVIAKAGASQDYELDFGTDGANGKFRWSGEHTAWVVGGGINAVVDMKMSIVPSTKITKVTV